VPQFPLIRDATRAFSLPCIEEEGLEADDIIACYSLRALEEGWKVTIVSSDKDLMQLIDDGRLDMLDTMNDRRMDRAYVEEKFGVGPEKLGDVLALMGDSVDNVPGVPGIGPKTAAQLIQQYGDLDTLLSRVDEITKPKLKQNLTQFADDARMSRELVRLVCDSPLPQPLDSLGMQGIPDAPLREFLEHHGFRSLLARLNGQSQVRAPSTDPAQTPVQREVRPEPKIDRSLYETVTTEGALNRWIAEATALGHVAVDTETDGRDCITARLVGISLATECNRACYIPLEHGGEDLIEQRPEQLGADWVLAKLKPLLEDPAILKIGHNIKFDWVLFDRRGSRSRRSTTHWS
jgi:DNA polymerase-1